MWRMFLLGPTPVPSHLPRLAHLTIPGRWVPRRSPLLLQVGQLPDFSKEPAWDAEPSAMELAGEIPLAEEDEYVPILGEDHLAEDRERLERKRAAAESPQTPKDAPAAPETAPSTPSTDAKATDAIPAMPPCQGKQNCKVLKKKLAKMERKMWLSTKLEEKKRAHDAVRHLFLTPPTSVRLQTLSTRGRDAWGWGVSEGIVHGERRRGCQRQLWDGPLVHLQTGVRRMRGSP